MKMNDLEKVLAERDGLTQEEVNEQINEMRERMLEGEDPEELLYENGLESDYILDLLY